MVKENHKQKWIYKLRVIKLTWSLVSTSQGPVAGWSLLFDSCTACMFMPLQNISLVHTVNWPVSFWLSDLYSSNIISRDLFTLQNSQLMKTSITIPRKTHIVLSHSSTLTIYTHRNAPPHKQMLIARSYKGGKQSRGQEWIRNVLFGDIYAKLMYGGWVINLVVGYFSSIIIIMLLQIRVHVHCISLHVVHKSVKTWT